MKRCMKNKTLLITALVTLPTFGVISAAADQVNPDVKRAEIRAESAENMTSDTKAALADLDREIESVERALDQAPTAEQKADLKRDLAAIKERRSELRKDYVEAKYQELKADSALAAKKVAAWTKDTYEVAKEKVVGPEPRLQDKAYAAVNLEANRARAELAIYRLTPNPENKKDVKVALKELDREIDRLDDYADELPKGEARSALERRVKALEQREKEIKRDFTKARWDALVEDIRKEWNDLVS